MRMLTSTPIYFAFLVLVALIAIAFGIHTLVIVSGLILTLIAFLFISTKIKHPYEWKAQDYAVRVRGGRDAWVEYEEVGGKLLLRGDWGVGDLNVLIEQ